MISCGSWEIFSSRLRTVIFCIKRGWSIFSRTRRISIGKKIPISAFNPDLNLVNKLMNIEHRSWNMVITDSALFFSNDKQRNCLIILRKLQQRAQIRQLCLNGNLHSNILCMAVSIPRSLRKGDNGKLISEATTYVITEYCQHCTKCNKEKSVH